MSKVCPNCQNTVEQDDRAFCPHCGYAFDMEVRLAMQMQRMLKDQAQEKTIKKEQKDEAPMRPIVTKDEEEDFSKLHRTEKKSSPLPIIIGILFVIVIIAIVFLIK